MWGRDFPRIQIATIEQLLAGPMPDLPYGMIGSQKAPRIKRTTGPKQTLLTMGGIDEDES